MHKRFEVRRAVRFPMELITGAWDDPIVLQAGDLSPRGAYVYSELLPDKGEHVVCTFDLPAMRRSCCFFAEVTRVNLLRRTTDLGHPGFGIRFLDAEPLDRLRLRSALVGLPPPLPGPAR